MFSESMVSEFLNCREFSQFAVKLPVFSRDSHDPSPNSYLGMLEEEYSTIHWPLIRDALHQLLNQTPDNAALISFEQTYTAVYKCVCRMFAEKLYYDLMDYVKIYLETVALQLRTTTDENFLPKYSASLHQYMFALKGIAPIFTYMDRCYLAGWKHTDLTTELHRLFAETVADDNTRRAMQMLTHRLPIPMSISPALVSELCQNLHKVKSDYCTDYPQIFSRYVPNCLPPMQDEDITREIEATRQFQETLRSQGFNSGDQSRKRSGDDDSDCINPPCQR